MIDFIKLANNLDKSGDYVSADFLTKISMEIPFLENYNPLGEGMYGTYKTDFSKEDRSKLEGIVGRVPSNVGVKEFWGNSPMLDMMEENLAIYFIAPYIGKNSAIKVPNTSMNTSLSSMLSGKKILSGKINGVHIEYDGAINNNLSYKTEKSILEKLKSIGVRWEDCHQKNYMVDPSTLSKRIELLEKFEAWELPPDNDPIYDLSDYATIVDFGRMKIAQNTPPGQAMWNLALRLEKDLPRNRIAQKLRAVIWGMVR